MDKQFDDEEEARRQERWKNRITEMKREKEKREQLQGYIKRYAWCGGAILFAVIIICVGVALSHKKAKVREKENVTTETTESEIESSTLENTASDTAKTAALRGAEEAQQPVMSVETGVVQENNGISGGETAAGNEDAVPEELTTMGEVVAGSQAGIVTETGDITVGDVTFRAGYSAETTADTIDLGDTDVLSSYAILVDASSGTIVAQKNAKTIINPASMTKILTVLVAAEHVTDLDDKFTMTLDITDYAYVNDCSSVGFLDNETITVRDLFYGTVLPSGGDAAVALATYVAGSQEAFVEMMNEKLEELGLSETAHVTNCVGLYDENHYCTVYDMAMILKAAAENDLCREVLSAHTYTTSSTEEHPDGITVSNWFLRRIEDKETGGEVLCAKTGYVDQSGSCAASYEISDNGTPYICVTAKTYSSWRCIYDHVAMYSLYAE